MKNKFLILILLLSTLQASAKLEKAANGQDLLRQSLSVNSKTTIYGQEGLGLIDSTGLASSEINLSRNDNGDLNWNNNKVIDFNGQVNTQNLAISGAPGGQVLFQSANGVTSKVQAQQETISLNRKTRSRLLLLESGGSSIKWAFPRTLTTNPAGANNTCEKACASISGANVPKTLCTAAHEGIFKVDCNTPSGFITGVNNSCTCLSFQTFNAI